MSFRDSNIVLIETGRTVVRAGLGLHDLLKTPSVDFPARVGLRKSASEENSNDPPPPEGSKTASGSRVSSLPQHSPPNASVNDYLVGKQLDEALASGQDLDISWPFADGDVRDWVQAEALWKYAIINQLHRRRAQNESPVLLSIFPGLSRATYERICQIFFERFNVAGFGIVDRPMAQLYAANSLNGVVVDIGYEKTDISPIYEGFLVHNALTTCSVGSQDCEMYLAHLLRSNTSVVNTISPPESPLSPDDLQSSLLELVRQVWEEGYIKIPSSGETAIPEDEGITDIAAIVMAGKEKAVIESGMKKKATAKASAAEQARAREIEAMDLVEINFRGRPLTLGKERHRFCEPLFDPNLLDSLTADADPKKGPRMPLQDAVGHAVRQTEVDQRQYIYGGVFVTGDITRHVKGVGIALQSRLAPFLVSNPELLTDVQPRAIRVLTLPEYYPEYRDTGEGYAAFLGTSIVGKITYITDAGSKSYVSKADYSSKGPHSIIETSPSLL